MAITLPRSDQIPRKSPLVEVTEVFHGGGRAFEPEPGFSRGRPNLSFVGEGEGGDMAGWGFYAGQARGTGQFYQITSPDGTVGGVKMDWADPLHEAAMWLHTFDGDAQEAVEFLENVDQGSQEAIDLLRHNAPLPMYTPELGALYKLELPDEDIAKFLDWDKPLSEQNATVQEFFETRRTKPLEEQIAFQRERIKELTVRGRDRGLSEVEIEAGLIIDRSLLEEYEGELVKARLIGVDRNRTGGDLYNELAKELGSKKEASLALRDAGIPGNRFLDQFSRGINPSAPEVAVFRRKIDERMELIDRLKNEPSEAINKSRIKNAQDQIKNLRAALAPYIRSPTHNFVVWDQDVLDRTQLLELNDKVFPDEVDDLIAEDTLKHASGAKPEPQKVTQGRTGSRSSGGGGGGGFVGLKGGRNDPFRITRPKKVL